MHASVEIELFGIEGEEVGVSLALGDVFGHNASSRYLHEGVHLRTEGPEHLVSERVCGPLEALGVSYLLRQAGSAQFTGEWIAYTPELGRYRANADQEKGDRLIGVDRLFAVLDEMPEDPDDVWLREQLEVTCGCPWNSEINRLRTAALARRS